MEEHDDNCVLLFSGGRDSTLAALRLAAARPKLTLVTATSDHLVGIDAVHRRLQELAPMLREATWLRVRQPATANIRAFTAPTCLPCHAAYAAVGVAIARENGVRVIAFGYAGYQSTWPEQTELAVETLRRVLAEQALSLLLPVYDVHAKGDAIAALTSFGISPSPLEQKCTQQQFNVDVPAATLHAELDIWAMSIRATVAAVLETPPVVLERVELKDLR